MVIDLQQPCIQIFVNHQVVSEQLKHLTLNIFSVCNCIHCVLYKGGENLSRLRRYSVDVGLDSPYVHILGPQRLVQRSEGSFRRIVDFQEFRTFNEAIALLVKGVVRQVHVAVIHVLNSWLLIGDGAEASETFIADESLEGLESDDDDIDSEVELEAVYQQRVVFVPLNHKRVSASCWDILQASEKLNSNAL